ncbi:MAG: hypothetical protein LPK07_01530 [Hymenobacteraceae bacterium]|nr:hypothetical protein [Hymenobacteraceae bacterium]MDX5480341.1 hypothetical protein [Hymenobacteraceae bacterium]
MKLVLLLLAVVLGFCLACKETFDARNVIAQRQQLLATATPQDVAAQPQTIQIL